MPFFVFRYFIGMLLVSRILGLFFESFFRALLNFPNPVVRKYSAFNVFAPPAIRTSVANGFLLTLQRAFLPPKSPTQRNSLEST